MPFHVMFLSMSFQEKLGDGGNLHVIDFEQLKIENQAYSEKIEERNDVSPFPFLCAL